MSACDNRVQIGRIQNTKERTCSPLTPQEGKEADIATVEIKDVALLFPFGKRKFVFYVCEFLFCKKKGVGRDKLGVGD